MSKVRIFEWGKENHVGSSIIVKRLKEEGYKVRNHTDVVEDSILQELFPPRKKAQPTDGKPAPADEIKAAYNKERNNAQNRNQGDRKPYNNNTGERRPYNNNNSGERRPYNNNNNQGENRPYNNNQGERRPYNNNNTGERRPYNNNNTGERRPYNNNQGENRPYNNDRKPYNNQQGGNRPYNNQQGGNRPYNNTNQTGERKTGYQGNNYDPNYKPGERKPYNNQQGGNRPYNNQQGGNRPYNNQQGGNRPYGGGNAQGGNRPYSPRPQGGPGGAPRRPFGQKPEEEKPAIEQKKATKKTINAKKKKPSFDRFAQFDNKEVIGRIDQKTRTQMKKDARKERQSEIASLAKEIKWTIGMTVADFAKSVEIPAIDIIGKLFELGIMATMNQPMDRESAEIICTDYNVTIIEDDSFEEFEIENLITEYQDEDLAKRPPIVTIMGHVDHGKTTLLDTIRNSNVTAKESGGITQHIGAYQIDHNGSKITFLDTPGHEAFTAMRARGADITDIAILVVAADDGVMPQTRESIAHAKEAKIPMIVAVNKMDKEGANPDRIMAELAEHGILSEEWGGDVPFVQISALNNMGIDSLLEYIEVVADMHDYKAPDKVLGFGTVIEAHLDRGQGSVATILVQGGHVKVGDPIVIGHTYGSIRTIQDEYGKRHKNIGPSFAAQITGIKDVPLAGDDFVIMSDLKEAQVIGEKRSMRKNMMDRGTTHALSLDELNEKIKEGNFKELPVLIKGDVQGSVEALAASLEKIDVNGVKIRIIHKGVGPINESDVMLATAGTAIMIGFNVRPDANARRVIEKEKVELLLSNIIYKIIEEIEDSMNGMRDKVYREEILGYAKVGDVFKISNVGKVAGCVVTEGKIVRSGKIRLVRDSIVIYDGDIGQLKRYKDDVNEVIQGMDCGLSFKDFEDLRKGDEIECYSLIEEE